MEKVVLINEQCYIRKNNRQLEKQNQCKGSKPRKRLFKYTSKPSYMSHKIFDNNLVSMQKSKVALKLNELHALKCVF